MTKRMILDAPYNEAEPQVLGYLHQVPPPIKGGTFFYCPCQRETARSLVIYDILKPGRATCSRFRTAAAYRRHYRRYHERPS
jgi:hypothetical protein